MSDLKVTPPPALHRGTGTRALAADVLIALIPSALAGIWLFGLRACAVLAVCIGAAVSAETLACAVLRRPNAAGDLSCIVTGALLGLSLPVSIPLWQAALGAAAAVAFVKMLFGGFGCNFVNPAMAGRALLALSFPAAMSATVLPSAWQGADITATATPLVDKTTDLLPLFLGLHGGAIGETCVPALLLGGLYLCIRRAISPLVPLTMLGTVAALSALCGEPPLYALMSGGVLFAAVFCVTDPVTTPVTRGGRVLFALLVGVLTVLLRRLSPASEGVMWAVLAANLLAPLMDKLPRPGLLGGRRRRHG